jgi:ornithine--oxo-acid transaminase
MNTGAEGVETALKLARKWGYLKKGIPDNQAVIVSATGCFHGRTIGVISMSSDPSSKRGFGPFVPGMIKVPYNDVEALRQVLDTQGSQVAGFLVEPIQGEAGVIVPDPGYLRACADLCRQHHVLLIVDEVQTGLSRCGKLLCQEWDGVRGDIVILGKALSGGMMPISCILADREIMLCISPGEHGSTFGGNPLASATAIAALQVLVDENLADNANAMGELFRQELQKIQSPYIKQIRGKGLLNAIEITTDSPLSAWDICMILKEKGLITKPTHETSIRLAPPLTIQREDILHAAQMIHEVFVILNQTL